MATTGDRKVPLRQTWEHLPNPLESMRGEQAEAIAILREVCPNMGEGSFAGNAVALRTWRYEHGRYPTADEIHALWPHW